MICKVFKASKGFEGGVSLEQILSACLPKSHNIYSQFYLKGLAWGDKKLFDLSPMVVLSRYTIVSPKIFVNRIE